VASSQYADRRRNEGSVAGSPGGQVNVFYIILQVLCSLACQDTQDEDAGGVTGDGTRIWGTNVNTETCMAVFRFVDVFILILFETSFDHLPGIMN
jgi:hypothetical protein